MTTITTTLNRLGKDAKKLAMELFLIEDEINLGATKNLTDLMHSQKELRAKLDETASGWKRPYDSMWEKFDDLPAEQQVEQIMLMREGGAKKGRAKTASKWDAPWAGKGSTGSYSKCAHSHPLLTIEGAGTIQGGSCYSPQGEYDIELGFDAGMKTPSMLVPWGTAYYRYPIVDRSVPADFKSFDRLVDWTLKQMRAGKSVHCGCIGGHGRTGLFLSALVFKATGNTNATQWVRENYCKKAVETDVQTAFLHKHYGIEKVAASKDSWKTDSYKPGDKAKVDSMKFFSGAKSDAAVVYPLPGMSVWGDTKLT